MRSARSSYSLLVLAAAALWGTTGTAQALAPATAQPIAVGAVRIALGGAALVAFAALNWSVSRGDRPATRKGAWTPGAVAAAALGVALYQPLFFAGVAYAGVSIGTVVAIGSAPVMAGIVGFVALGEQPGKPWAVATLLAVAGCALLVGSGNSGKAAAVGILCALGAGLCYGSYATASKALMERGLSQAAVMAAVFGLGGALLAPALLFVDLGWLAEPSGFVAALHLGLIATAAAYLLFAKGLSGLPVSTAATLSLAEPLTAGALGILLLGERLALTALIGAVLLLGGLFLVSSSGTERRDVESPASPHAGDSALRRADGAQRVPGQDPSETKRRPSPGVPHKPQPGDTSDQDQTAPQRQRPRSRGGETEHDEAQAHQKGSQHVHRPERQEHALIQPYQHVGHAPGAHELQKRQRKDVSRARKKDPSESHNKPRLAYLAVAFPLQNVKPRQRAKHRQQSRALGEWDQIMRGCGEKVVVRHDQHEQGHQHARSPARKGESESESIEPPVLCLQALDFANPLPRRLLPGQSTRAHPAAQTAMRPLRPPPGSRRSRLCGRRASG